MFRSLAPACTLFAYFTTAALCQNYGLVCNAGIRADGYIDFSGLPPAPVSPVGPGAPPPSSPITAKMPVLGIPGLTVQVTIPSLTSSFGGSPLYSVGSGTLDFVSNPNGGGYVQFEFNRPVYGLSLEGNAGSRGASFSLVTNEATGKGTSDGLAPNFQNAVDVETLGYYHFNTQLQAVGNLSEALVYFPYAGYGSPFITNLRVQSQSSSNTALVPRDGLEQWLMSDPAYDPFAGSAASWPDQSGKGHNATQTSFANEPLQTASSGQNCRGGFIFSQNRYFNFNLPIDGWEQMTVFLVAKTFANPPSGSYASQSAAILWSENASWGNTFVTPLQTSVPFRFGTEQVGNQPIYARPAITGQDFTISRTVHDKSVDSLYVDGIQVLSQENKRPVLAGTSGAAFLGRGINNTYFNGELSEVLIYRRVLSANEAASVESYLRNKFGTR
jgi:hypothetical protein